MTPDPTPTDPARPEPVDLGRSLQLVVIALVSAAVVATLVIAIGGALMKRPASVAVPGYRSGVPAHA